MITRRGLFGILAGAVAAPIVVRSGLLMPVSTIIRPHIEYIPPYEVYFSEWSYSRYVGYDALNITAEDVIAAAEYVPQNSWLSR